ncbi:MAG: response regulator [Candidatus Omnitrophica bacterium]|nr:response regulator [Candidatus Omnitrophota bacterium]
MKIIVVDDSLLDRKLLTRTLVNLGVKNEILQADNGEAGLSLIASNLGDIALIFLDYQMPIMTGIEVMEGLVGVPATADLPIIMVTASASEESKQVAYSANPNLVGYVLKPFKPDQILAVIKPYVQLNA